MKKILFFALVLAGCEKKVDITYKNNASTIVIAGAVTNEAGPYFVNISKSLPLSSTEAYPTIDNAVVRISDNAGNRELLTAQGNGRYRTNSLHGEAGRTYTLTVQMADQTYTAQSTMPQVVPFDSIK